jgi:uncharacterized RDD family membrane protein YckC
VNIVEGLRELSGWGFGADPQAGLPPGAYLLWWCLTCVGYTAYCLIMELMTARTVGKVLIGARVLSERGVPASAGQVAVRNLFRLIELMPQFWILAFMALLTRNRQRLGDIFARTVVVRRNATEAAATATEAEAGGEEAVRPKGEADSEQQPPDGADSRS